MMGAPTLRGDAAALLDALGVPGAGDDPLLEFVLQDVTQTIQNETNRAELPPGLSAAAAQMAAGQYLRMKKGAGLLDGFDLEAAVKQLREGDTDITFALGGGSSTPEERLDDLLRRLTDAGAAQLAAFRKLRW